MEPKKQGVEDDFLGELADNNIDPFTAKSNDDLFPEDESKKEEINDEVKESKSVPFAKDEKIQRYIDRQVEKRMKNFQPSATESFKQEVSGGDPDLVRAFATIIGEDTPDKLAALKALELSLAKVDERATQKAIERLQQVQEEAQEKEAKELEDAQNEIEDGFDEIENHYKIELTERQKEEYKKFLLKVEPKGGYQEYPDFVETFEVFKNHIKAQRPSNSQAKSLASRGLERSSSNTDSMQVVKRQGTKSLWQELDKLF